MNIVFIDFLKGKINNILRPSWPPIRELNPFYKIDNLACAPVH